MSWELSMSAWADIYNGVESLLYTWSEQELIDAIVCDESAKEFDGIIHPIIMITDESQRKEKVSEITIFENTRQLFYKDFPKDILVHQVLAMIEDNATTSNGGHELYIDREGYFTLDMSDVDEHLEEGY